MFAMMTLLVVFGIVDASFWSWTVFGVPSAKLTEFPYILCGMFSHGKASSSDFDKLEVVGIFI